MSSVAVLGLVWALVGVPLVVRYFQERRPLPMEEFQRAMGALQSNGPAGGSAVQAAQRRRLVSTLTYSPGLALLAIGLPLSDIAILAVGLALVNLGTTHRLVGLAVDRSPRHHRVPQRLPAAPIHPVDPPVEHGSGDTHSWGEGWQIIGPESRRVDDLVLIDADHT